MLISPLMAILFLGGVLGTLGFIGALIFRKRGCAVLALPCPLLLVAWLILIMIPPNAEMACRQLFGDEVYMEAREIKTVKPMSMDGYFISFEISPEAFQRLIRPQLQPQILGDQDFYGRHAPPRGWPTGSGFRSEVLRAYYGEDNLLVHYEESMGRFYGAYRYGGW